MAASSCDVIWNVGDVVDDGIGCRCDEDDAAMFLSLSSLWLLPASASSGRTGLPLTNSGGTTELAAAAT